MSAAIAVFLDTAESFDVSLDTLETFAVLLERV